jgi:hypothetical protein
MNKFYFILEPPSNFIDFDSQGYVNDLIDSLYAEKQHLYLQHHLESKYLIMNQNTYAFVTRCLRENDSLRLIANNVDMRSDVIKYNQMQWQLLGHTVLINNSLENFEYEIR